MMYTYLERLLMKHEGVRLFPYKDTVGKITIGVGRNLTDVGISRGEAVDMLREDIARVMKDATERAPWIYSIDNYARRVALFDMIFNLGITGFLRFKKTIAAIKAQDWDTASQEMLDSRWARQVGRRATELAEMVRTGVATDD